ncbi:L-ribulokinase [Phycisphaerales bacterium]|nr:L-ribulokinase [Phycisphaerales bacterium]
MSHSPTVLGIDFGTNSVRAVVIDPADGRTLGTGIAAFQRGDQGVISSPSDPHLARQHPADYVETLAAAVAAAIEHTREVHESAPASIRAIGIDSTASTPIPVDRANTPLALLPDFASEPDAMAWLWKDHTSHAEAAAITSLAREQQRPYLAKCGGSYSSEWFWSKILHCWRTNPRVAQAAYSWVELCDWVPAYLCGHTGPASIKRSICAAGHKGLYHESWGGPPSPDFLDALAPGLSRLRDTISTPALAADKPAGTLAPHIAARLGLPPGIPVAVGAIDAHLGAVGSGCAPGTLVKIIGTSTCDCIAVPLAQPLADIPGVCGIVPESILPGCHGIEAGQSAVGDIFNWFVSRVLGHSGDAASATHASLTADAAKLSPAESGLLTLDWHNGNRTILVDPMLTGLTLGQTLATTPADIYRSLIESTAFGTRMILDRLTRHGVAIDRIVCCGGIAEKNALLMQIYADVLQRPMHIAASDQACALGAAVFASVVGRVHPNVPAAQSAMTGTRAQVYRPDPRHTPAYDSLFNLYRTLHDAFGTPPPPGSLFHVMKELLAIQAAARRS